MELVCFCFWIESCLRCISFLRIFFLHFIFYCQKRNIRVNYFYVACFPVFLPFQRELWMFKLIPWHSLFNLPRLPRGDRKTNAIMIKYFSGSKGHSPYIGNNECKINTCAKCETLNWIFRARMRKSEVVGERETRLFGLLISGVCKKCRDFVNSQVSG